MTLDEANQLLAWMRENGVVSARVGDVALVIGEQPPQVIDPNSPWATYLREKAGQTQTFATPEEDPDLYGGRPPPGLDE